MRFVVLYIIEISTYIMKVVVVGLVVGLVVG